VALLSIEEARQAGRVESSRLNKSVTAALNEATRTSLSSFDVFLSHSRLDAEIVLGVKRKIEQTGKTVYVDWIDDPQLDRSRVTPATAQQLRIRMKQCRALFYAHSNNATKSRWMPWELGYFDGFSGNVAVLPLVATNDQQSYIGEEFLGLYPYVDFTRSTIYIHRSITTYASFENWRAQADKLRPAA
jgi:hypothetical protein